MNQKTPLLVEEEAHRSAGGECQIVSAVPGPMEQVTRLPAGAISDVGQPLARQEMAIPGDGHGREQHGDDQERRRGRAPRSGGLRETLRSPPRYGSVDAQSGRDRSAAPGEPRN